MKQIATAIAEALGPAPTAQEAVTVIGAGTLRSCFDVTGLALASVSAAAAELAALKGTGPAIVNRRHALQWFDMTLRPQGWSLPSAWDPIAGDYAASDGWIRLHTNAPHHRAAALSVLGCPAERDVVANTVARWSAQDLEEAIVTARGCAAQMHSLAGWVAHPQGRAVAQEPLIDWTTLGNGDAARVDLEGLKVLDLTRVLAGPVATRFLAGFGADVLRIDPPDWSEPGVEPEVTLGKRCAGLNLRDAGDRDVFQALLRQADVLVHGYRPGALEALGFDPETRRALNPTLIDVSLNAYGWTGSWTGRRGFDSLVQMSCGIADQGMRQFGRDRPTPLPVQALDHATGYLMAAAILRALRVRNQSGTVLRARLSLARTAQLLIAADQPAPSDALEPETEADVAPQIEHTGWGPARRIVFPVTLPGRAARWPQPASPLRRHAARWALSA